MLPTANDTDISSNRSPLSLWHLAVTVVAAWTIYAGGIQLASHAQVANFGQNSIWSNSLADITSERQLFSERSLAIIPAEVGSLNAPTTRLGLRAPLLPNQSLMTR